MRLAQLLELQALSVLTLRLLDTRGVAPLSVVELSGPSTLLLDAAKNDAERRTLAELNERVPAPPAPKTRIAAGSQRPADAASNAVAEPGASEKIPAKEAESGLIMPSPVHPTS